MSRVEYDLTTIKGIVFDIDGVLSPSTIPMDSEGVPMRMVNIKDGYALQLAVRMGLKIAIITGGKEEAIRKRYMALGITDVFLGSAQKLPILEKWAKDMELAMNEIAYMGDDIPDLQCLRAVGLSTCPHDAAWEVKSECRYISPFTGGYGCGRDLIEQVLRTQGLWLADHRAFGW